MDRSEWEAVAPKSFLPITGSVRKVFIHHTVGNKCTSKVTCSSTVRNTQTYHMSERSKIQVYESGHEKMRLMPYANNKGADQPAHPRSQISAFLVRCLDSIISLDSTAEISRT